MSGFFCMEPEKEALGIERRRSEIRLIGRLRDGLAQKERKEGSIFD